MFMSKVIKIINKFVVLMRLSFFDVSFKIQQCINGSINKETDWDVYKEAKDEITQSYVCKQVVRYVNWLLGTDEVVDTI